MNICCSTGGAQDFSSNISESAMATEVDTWSPAPQKDGECTNAAPPHPPTPFLTKGYVGAKCPGAALGPVWRALPGPLSVHGMGCSASHARHVLVLKADTRTRNSAAEDGGSERIVQPRCIKL